MTEIRYPRNRLARGIFNSIGRTLLNLLTRPQIEGQENYPTNGGLIVVANHSGLLETVMMTSFAPRQIEYMGSVDLPHEKFLAMVMNAYQFIPVYRGNVSISAMKDGVSVLKQGGVIGIFPEGGIWEPAIRKAHSGVAWMSYHGHAPVLPIGFTPTAGALGKALSLKRPILEMRIGEIIPPVTITTGIPKKVQFQEAAQNIMDTVWNLVPQGDSPTIKYLDETFDFEIFVFSKDETPIEIPAHLQLVNGKSLSKILYRTTLINNFRDNLKIDISPLKQLRAQPPSDQIRKSTGEILSYLLDDNPYYFTYRYGQEEGTQMLASLQEFHHLAAWADQNGYRIHAVPIRWYRPEGNSREIIETHPPELDKW